ncbi:hypothetical protein BU17DRAFT_102520 [Hysterangium stoloniferum]|nr:hypothetical protein BU17DRAFT_102520 [Hysterangium stoloniferum]
MNNRDYYSQYHNDNHSQETYPLNEEASPSHTSRARPFMLHNTQHNGGMDPYMQTYNNQPLPPSFFPVNPDWEPAGSASLTGSAMTNVSYPNNNLFIPPFDVPSDYSGFAPRYPRAGSDTVVHRTWQVDTGEEEAMRRYIHRYTDEEKRRMQVPLANRPIRSDALVAQNFHAVSKRIAMSRTRGPVMYAIVPVVRPRVVQLVSDVVGRGPLKNEGSSM